MSFFESPETMEGNENLERTVEVRESEPMRVFVDFGAGKHPVAEVDPRRFQGNNRYIALDYDLEELRRGKEALSKREEGDIKTNALFVHAEKDNIPLQDQTVDEIYFGNVFGEPYRKEFKKEGDAELISTGVKSQAEIFLLVKEARRVLKDDGTLIVLETYTPIDSNEKALKEVLKKTDFKIDRIIRAGDPTFETEWRKYDIFHTNVPDKEHPMGEPYILYARKTRKLLSAMRKWF